MIFSGAFAVLMLVGWSLLVMWIFPIDRRRARRIAERAFNAGFISGSEYQSERCVKAIGLLGDGDGEGGAGVNVFKFMRALEQVDREAAFARRAQESEVLELEKLYGTSQPNKDKTVNE